MVAFCGLGCFFDALPNNERRLICLIIIIVMGLMLSMPC